MASSQSSDERRRHPRHPIRKPVRTTIGEDTHLGATRDISAGGAAIDWDETPEDDFDEEDYLDLDIDDVGYVAGQVTRPLDGGVSVRFMDIDDEEEDRLISELADIDREVGLAEE
ncbi:MAG: PilZ domain-containing protein [Rhodospirillales bacterium]|jgi:hypothetical protein|nr:PilZ domain-containing protein [Rhodospirillales bacterium]